MLEFFRRKIALASLDVLQLGRIVGRVQGESFDVFVRRRDLLHSFFHDVRGVVLNALDNVNVLEKYENLHGRVDIHIVIGHYELMERPCLEKRRNINDGKFRGVSLLNFYV